MPRLVAVCRCWLDARLLMVCGVRDTLAALRGLMGMTIAGLLPAIAKLMRQTVDDRSTGKALGYLQSAQFSGQVIGPLIGGQIGAHVGLHQVFFVTGSLLVLCAALNHWGQSRRAQ